MIQRREWDENEERYVECGDGHVVLYQDYIAELEQWKTWGIVEISVRNPNVASYIEHWEGRAIKAESALAHKEYYDAMRAREIDMSLIPEPQKPLVAALLNQRDDSYRQKEDAIKENEKLINLLAAASHALRSYQYGNVATDLAKELADSIDKEIADGTKP